MAASEALSRPGHARWRVVATQELRDLWLGARGPVVLLVYSLLLSVLAYLSAGNADLNLLDARESVGVLVQVAITVGALAALVAGADTIAGERERGTLEHLLLTPTPLSSIVSGKLIAALSVWFAAMLIAIPYVVALGDGPGVSADGVVVLIVAGSLISVALAGLGLAVSAVASSNRVSIAASIVILLVLAAPSQLPQTASRGTLGDVLIRANPVSAGLKLASNVLVDQRSWGSQWGLLIAPAIAAALFIAIAIVLARRVKLGGLR